MKTKQKTKQAQNIQLKQMLTNNMRAKLNVKQDKIINGKIFWLIKSNECSLVFMISFAQKQPSLFNDCNLISWSDSYNLINPLTSRVKPWMTQSFVTFESMDRTLKCDHSLESCWAVLYCACNFRKFINFWLGTLRSERAKVRKKKGKQREEERKQTALKTTGDRYGGIARQIGEALHEDQNSGQRYSFTVRWFRCWCVFTKYRFFLFPCRDSCNFVL